MNESFDLELIQHVRDGQDEYFPILWKKVKGYVYRKANRLLLSKKNYGVEEEDLEQAGRIALLNAARQYDPDKGSFFALFVLMLKNEFAIACSYRNERIKNDPLNIALSLDEPISEEGENDASKYELIPDPNAEMQIEKIEQKIWNKELHTAIERELDELTEKQSNVIRQHYWNGLTFREIGEAYGISGNRAAQIEQNAILRIKHRRELEQWLEDMTPYYQKVGRNKFKSTWTSATEYAVLRREQLLEHWKDRHNQ